MNCVPARSLALCIISIAVFLHANGILSVLDALIAAQPSHMCNAHAAVPHLMKSKNVHQKMKLRLHIHLDVPVCVNRFAMMYKKRIAMRLGRLFSLAKGQ